ncbi:MAG: GW dipeptide domain-containing protein [Candidatus Saccharibacteria bacterium]
MKSILVVLVMMVAFTSCVKKNKVPTAQEVTQPGTHEVTVQEVVQTTGYTYLRVQENGAEKWIAVNRMEAAPGEKYYYAQEGLEMKDFNSKELNRTFPTIYFVDALSKDLVAAPAHGALPNKPVQPTLAQKEGVSVAPAVEGLTIAKLYADRQNYEGKNIKMKGQVTKINEGVMGKNWVHIQDGTNDSGNFDLTITTNDVVKMDDVVTFEGPIHLKKDFGYGYFYEVIMEDAKLVK